VVGLALVNEKDEVMLVTNRGQTIRTRVDEIRLTGRNAQGVRVMNVEADERVVAIEPVGERDEDDGPVSVSDEKIEASVEDTDSSETNGVARGTEAGFDGSGDDASGEDGPSDDTGEDDTGEDDAGEDEPGEDGH
jgi:DNA gyrase subunit A